MLVILSLLSTAFAAAPKISAIDGLALYLANVGTEVRTVNILPAGRHAVVHDINSAGAIHSQNIPESYYGELDQASDISGLPLPSGAISEHGTYYSVRGTRTSLVTVTNGAIEEIAGFTNNWPERVVFNRIYERPDGPYILGHRYKSGGTERTEEGVLWHGSAMSPRVIDLNAIGSYSQVRPWAEVNGELYGFARNSQRSIPWRIDTNGVAYSLPARGDSSFLMDAARFNTNVVAVGAIGMSSNRRATLWLNNEIAAEATEEFGSSALLTISEQAGLAGGYSLNREGSILCMLATREIITFEKWWKAQGGGDFRYHTCGIHAIEKVGSVLYFSLFGGPWIIASIDTEKPKFSVHVVAAAENTFEVWHQTLTDEGQPVILEISPNMRDWQEYFGPSMFDGQNTRYPLTIWEPDEVRYFRTRL